MMNNVIGKYKATIYRAKTLILGEMALVTFNICYKEETIMT